MSKLSKCASCSFANRASNKDWVHCLFWSSKMSESSLSPEEYVRQRIFKETEIANIAWGWAYPYQSFKEGSDYSGGTADSGLMWVDQLCIRKDEYCSNFKEKTY